jgi:ubiquinone/menaquinone biosynthesis C-methylase UbiE
MTHASVWDREYKNPQLVTLGDDARKDVRELLKDLRRKRGVDIGSMKVIDLGCGVGPNALYIAEHGAHVIGIDISPTAIDIAKNRARDAGIDIEYRVGNFGARLPFPDASFDLALDIMASNSLSERERDIYLREMYRILTPGGYVIYRGLCKDGDTNAKNLLRIFPGPEHDTYIMPKIHLVERVFSEAEFRSLYGNYFTIASLEKKSNYAHFDGKSFKRNYFVALLQRK